jgi:hypothetical protein
MSKEHVLARWIRKRFPNNGAQEHWHRTDLEDGAVHERRYRIVPFELTVREVCRRCNNGWMASLETKIQPILGPVMTSSIKLPLSIEEQESLASWAAKTLMVAQSTLPREQRVVPVEHHAELLAEQAAPTRCRVAVARRPRESNAWPYRLLAVGGEWRTKPPPGPRPTRDEFNAYRALLAVGHVVFHFLGFFDPDREEGLRPGDLPAGFVEIWPEPDRFVWSPEPEHRLQDLEWLMNLGRADLIRPRPRSKRRLAPAHLED